MPKSFNSRPKKLSTTSLINNNIMILYALIMPDNHDIDSEFVKKKKKKKQKQKKKIFRPTYPNFFGHVTGNTHTFLFGLIKNNFTSRYTYL